MNAYIITGASKGLGEALVRQIMEQDWASVLYCISRTTNDDLIDLALKKDMDLDWITYDLSDLIGLSEIVEDIMGELEARAEDIGGIYLINNAGVIGPVKTIEHIEPQALINNIHVNMIAPMILTGAFIRHTQQMEVEKRVLNISSGAAEHGYYGWSAYCSAKAGINLFTESVGLEQSYKEQGVEVLALAPGIVDTPMQAEIREASKEDFQEVDRFVAFKENGDLVHPEIVAKDVLTLLHAKVYPQGATLDLRDMEDINFDEQ